MRRGALRRGQWLSLLAAGMVGYLIGDWHAIALRTAALSATQSVALRFPEAKAEMALDEGADASVASQASIQGSLHDLTQGSMQGAMQGPMLIGGMQVALLDPTSMTIAPPRLSPLAAQPIRVASADGSVPMPVMAPVTAPLVAPAVAQPAAPVAAAPPRRLAPVAKAEKTGAKIETRLPAKAEMRVASLNDRARRNDSDRHGERAGFVLNDAQIASIKSRLHLSPDQEQMWPAVEAALRTIAYSKSRSRNHGAEPAEIASLDPYGPEVQGLKSAAVPLIMSFSEEQRSEVRTLAHVMGLDQLATQF